MTDEQKPTQEELLAQMLDQMSGVQNAGDITNTDRLKVAVCGEPKSGKSYLVGKGCRKPAIHWDFDDRRESLAGIPDLHVKTLVDKNDQDVHAWNDLEIDVGLMEYYKNSKGDCPFNSAILDSAKYVYQYAEAQALKNVTSITRHKFKIGSTEYIIARDWDAVVSVQKMLQGILRRLFALDIDVYMIFHTRNEKDQTRSTATNAVYKDNLTVDPPNLKMLLPLFNEQWRTYVENEDYRVQVKANYIFNGSTALKGLDSSEPADIQAMLAKHQQALKNLK